MEYLHFLNLFTEVLSKDAPFNQKYPRANQGTFAPKDSHEAIMNRSRLAIRFCTIKETSPKEYKKTEIFCSNLLLKARKTISQQKVSCKLWNPFFPNKTKSHRNLNLVEKGKLIDAEEIAKISMGYFVNIVQKLGVVIEKWNLKLT